MKTIKARVLTVYDQLNNKTYTYSNSISYPVSPEYFTDGVRVLCKDILNETSFINAPHELLWGFNNAIAFVAYPRLQNSQLVYETVEIPVETLTFENPLDLDINNWNVVHIYPIEKSKPFSFCLRVKNRKNELFNPPKGFKYKRRRDAYSRFKLIL